MKKLIALIILFCPSMLFGADYYVNPVCSSGCDGTTLAKGWTTLSAVVSSVLDDADTTLWISGGASGQTYTDELSISHATTNYTLTIRPMSAHPTLSSGHDGLVTFAATSGWCIDISGNNVTVDGKTSDSCVSTDIYGGGCRNFKMAPSAEVGGADGGPNTQNMIFRYIEATGFGSDIGSSLYAFRIDRCTSGCEIAYNYSHDHGSYSGVGCSGTKCAKLKADFYIPMSSGCSEFGQISVHHNKIDGVTTGDNFLTGCGTDVLYNYVEVDPELYHVDVAQTSGGTSLGIRYIRFIGNYFSSNNQMIFLENNSTNNLGMEHIHIYNNVFTTPITGLGKPILYGPASNVANTDIIIANNTFINTLYGIRLNDAGYTVTYTDSMIVNNIFYNMDSTFNADFTTANSTAQTWVTDSEFVVDYNLVYRPEGDISVRWKYVVTTPNSYQDYTSFTGTGVGAGDYWLSHHPTFSHNAAGQPLFNDYAGGDYTLAAGDTAAKDKGMDMLVYFTTDKDGNTRTGTWDIGAYEYGSSTPVTTIPQGVHIGGGIRIE